MAIAVPVIVSVATRWAPVLAETANSTVPFPDPDAPWLTVRNDALLTAVHAQPAGVVTAMDVEPPAAGKVVVVTPVMIWHVLEELPGATGVLPQAVAISSSVADKVTRARRPK